MCQSKFDSFIGQLRRYHQIPPQISCRILYIASAEAIVAGIAVVFDVPRT